MASRAALRQRNHKRRILCGMLVIFIHILKEFFF